MSFLFLTALKVFQKISFLRFTPHLSLCMAASPMNTGLKLSEGLNVPLTQPLTHYALFFVLIVES